jgi:bifunctional DNA-binding transcriptional regulator/antitoxin component of YhaV-PrlF toxin-antitoxin module
MLKVTSNRRITLPADQCKAANIAPGDDVVCTVDKYGIISIAKKGTTPKVNLRTK